MGSIWKSKVLPRFANVFGNSKKKTAAAEAVKSFDDSKEEFAKEFEEKKTELQPKVIEIYEASPPPIKALVKKPTESDLKKNSSGVKKFLDELVKIEFPGSKPVSEAAVKFGPSYVAGPITFIFQEVSSLLPVEEPPAAPAEATDASAPAEESASREVTAEVIEEIKKEEEVVKEEETPPPPPAATETPAPTEPAATDPPVPEPEPAKAEEVPPPEPAKA
ncbi:plasma membrane-associated cation-binding protein 1-like [Zingiber officinale]|uniref:plasma membrane-associated cation-binding protein 1-like n=1 Tax=Zingiber officinale TaxID=94328 RepID=UPI001C4BDF74|nr:plasma membrane-associated cation-binding protein 1-like [Zingiber officinale]